MFCAVTGLLILKLEVLQLKGIILTDQQYKRLMLIICYAIYGMLVLFLGMRTNIFHFVQQAFESLNTVLLRHQFLFTPPMGDISVKRSKLWTLPSKT